MVIFSCYCECGLPSDGCKKLLKGGQSFGRPLEGSLRVDDDRHEVLVVVRSHVVQPLVNTLVVTKS